jgi:hypothetical protein
MRNNGGALIQVPQRRRFRFRFLLCLRVGFFSRVGLLTPDRGLVGSGIRTRTIAIS